MVPAAPADRDERLAAAVDAMIDRERNGLPANPDDYTRTDPEIVEELRGLWATAQFAKTFRAAAKPLSGSTLTGGHTLAGSPRHPDKIGEYDILSELGRGGMGVVYKACQKSLKRVVALKVIREARLASDADTRRFREEAAFAAKLAHPNIVTVFDVGEWHGQPYFVMEFVEGRTLAQALAQRPFPPRESARIMARIARAIHHAHEQGVLHRDLKPSNILLTPTDDAAPDESGSRLMLQPKVTDFGLAKRLEVPGGRGSSRTLSGAIVGTPSYMSPEQATGRRELTPAADVYSLGAILYEMLTGRPPFQAVSPVDTLMQVVEQEPLPPRVFEPAIDRDLEMICLKCLEKLPARRYASAAEFAADLESYVAGEGLAAPPSGLSYFLSRMLRETHHAAVLENWGVLWMWHSLMVFLLCLLTQAIDWSGVGSHWGYMTLWSGGLITWGAILWRLRRRAGPVLFVERQIAHAWAAGVCASIGMFAIEVLIPLPPLTLSPAIAIAAGMVFIFKAGILSGRFYLSAAGMFLTAVAMTQVPEVGILLFGVTSALSFFFPGLKYYRLRRKSIAGG